MRRVVLCDAMPKAPAELGLTDVVVPLDKIAGEIVKSVK